MSRVKLSDFKIKSFVAPEKGQPIIWDSHVPGLGLRPSIGRKPTEDLKAVEDGMATADADTVMPVSVDETKGKRRKSRAVDMAGGVVVV